MALFSDCAARTVGRSTVLNAGVGASPLSRPMGSPALGLGPRWRLSPPRWSLRPHHRAECARHSSPLLRCCRCLTPLTLCPPTACSSCDGSLPPGRCWPLMRPELLGGLLVVPPSLARLVGVPLALSRRPYLPGWSGIRGGGAPRGCRLGQNTPPHQRGYI